ncbi:MAG TPA: hypothetical protein EYP17_11005, partial [Candidatus Latescibacteria bacterium]|nr:hypothetical protein [Candidatus Latescibacterota bacterium]
MNPAPPLINRVVLRNKEGKAMRRTNLFLALAPLERKILIGLATVLLAVALAWFADIHAAEVKLTAGDGEAGDYFGRSVSISGDYAIVGAYMDDDNGLVDS